PLRRWAFLPVRRRRLLLRRRQHPQRLVTPNKVSTSTLGGSAPASAGSGAGFSLWNTDKTGLPKEKPPIQLDGFCDSNASINLDAHFLLIAQKLHASYLKKITTVKRTINPERLRQSPRTGTEIAIDICSPPAGHQLTANRRLQGPNQHKAIGGPILNKKIQ